MKKIVISDAANITETANFCEKHGFSVNVDIFTDSNNIKNSASLINERLEVYKNVTIYSMHGPFHDLNAGSKDPLIREITEKRFESAYEISKKLSCKNIILHNGYIPGTSFPLKNWIERAKMFWDKFLKNKDNGTVFYIENVLEHDPAAIIDLINAVNNDYLKMCLDIGHANLHAKIKITDWIEKSNQYIGFVHMHNNYGEYDDHNGLDNGKINMLEVCNALEQYCPEATWEMETREYERSIDWLSLKPLKEMNPD